MSLRRISLLLVCGASLLLAGCAGPAAKAGQAAAGHSEATAVAATPVAAAPGDAAAAADSALAVADAFYRAHVEERASGVPEGRALQRYRPLLSKRLLGLIERAGARREAAIAAHPDEKPPFDDGDLFSSLFEGPTGYALGERRVLAPERERIAVALTYHDAQTAEDARWTDHALMLREDGRWTLDDIEYGGSWDFAARGRLSDALRSED